jgi:OmpR family response regulator RpaB
MHMPGERVLVADDEAQIRKVLRHRLEVAGYEVFTAEDGEQALELFHNIKPDLVILDISMPRLDGYQVCATIREVSDIPIMVLSARTDEPDRLAGLRLGADDYVTKPFSLAELVLRVQRC